MLSVVMMVMSNEMRVMEFVVLVVCVVDDDDKKSKQTMPWHSKGCWLIVYIYDCLKMIIIIIIIMSTLMIRTDDTLTIKGLLANCLYL